MFNTSKLIAKEKLLVLRKRLDWMDEFTGFNEVKKLQNQVIQCENRMTNAKEQHRLVNKDLLNMKNRLTELHEEMKNIDSSKNPKLLLKTTEDQLECSKRVSELVKQLDNIEEQERQAVMEMRIAIHSSHDKERLYAQRTKNINIFLTGVSLLFGISRFLKQEKPAPILANSENDSTTLLIPQLKRIAESLEKTASIWANSEVHLTLSLIPQLKRIADSLNNLQNLDLLKAEHSRNMDLSQFHTKNIKDVTKDEIISNCTGVMITLIIAYAFLKWIF